MTTTTRPLFRHRDLHWAGFHGVTAHQHANMEKLVAARCSVAGLTEQAGLRFSVPHWLTHGDESKIVWNSERWSLLEDDVVSIPTGRWRRGTDDDRHDLKLPVVLLRHRVRRHTLMRTEWHLAAHRQFKAQEQANRDMLDGMEAALLPLLREWEPDVFTGTGDFNRPLENDQQRQLVERAFAAFDTRLLVPPAPTIRGSLHRIDGAVTTRTGTHLVALPWAPGLDHRPLLEVPRDAA